MVVVLNIWAGGSLVWGCVCVTAFVWFCVFYRGETCRWWQKGCEAKWCLVVNGLLLDLRPRSIAGNTSLGLRRLLSFSPFLGCWHFSEAESGQLSDPCVTYWPIFQRPRWGFGEGWEQRRQEICKTRAGGKVLHRRRARQGDENKNLGERSAIERQDLDNIWSLSTWGRTANKIVRKYLWINVSYFKHPFLEWGRVVWTS